MDEEMFMLQNVMPVDLAIRRELEYRTKMGMSRNNQEVGFIPLVVVQRPAPTGMEARKRPRMSSFDGTSMSTLLHYASNQPILKPHSSSGSGLACLACQKPFANLFLLKDHGETLVHKGKVIQMKRRGENVSNPFHCQLCKCSCSSGNEMEKHLNGMRHAESFKMFEKAKRARVQGVFTANR